MVEVLGMRYEVISADSHVNEPPGTFVERVPAGLRERAPRVVPAPDGGEGWQFGDGPVSSFGLETAALSGGEVRPPEAYRAGGLRQADVARGSWEPKAHLADMRADGVDASVLYFGIGVRCYDLRDNELRLACIRAYNDWLAEFCAEDPQRLIGVALLPSEEETIEEAIGELRRALALGYRTVQVPIMPHRRYDDRFYDPLWAALEEAEVPVAIHRGLKRPGMFGGSAGGPWMSNQVQRDFFYAMPVGDFIFGGVFDRFPRLRLVSGEGRTGWLAHFVQRADESYRRHRHWLGVKLDRLPSEMVRENVYSTFIEDRVGILAREIIGVDNQMWSSDYPHSDSSWPHSRETIAEQFKGVPEDEVYKMVAGNATRLYKLG
jgi:predicted TIM-barrel fold metal-dependent hydrolase